MGFFMPEYCSGLHFLLQGIFLTRGSNLGLSHCRQILYRLSHQESPKGGEESLIVSDQVLYQQVVTSFEWPPSTFFSFNCPSPSSHRIYSFCFLRLYFSGFPGGSVVKNLPAKQQMRVWSLGGSGRSPGEGNGCSLHYSCLENPRHIWFKYGQRSLAVYSQWGHKRVWHDLETKQQQIKFLRLVSIHF